MSIGTERPVFNPIFRYFYDDAPDSGKLRGLVAYGLYKIAKREWALGIFEATGRKPSEDELSAYAQFWTPAQIDGKRAEAKIVLSEYADDIVEAAAPGIEKRALQGSIGRAILYGLAANLAYTALLIFIVFILKLSGVDVLGLAEKISAPR